MSFLFTALFNSSLFSVSTTVKLCFPTTLVFLLPCLYFSPESPALHIIVTLSSPGLLAFLYFQLSVLRLSCGLHYASLALFPFSCSCYQRRAFFSMSAPLYLLKLSGSLLRTPGTSSSPVKAPLRMLPLHAQHLPRHRAQLPLYES